MNNNAIIFQQALQTASFVAHAVEPVLLPAGRLAADAEPDAEPRVAVRELRRCRSGFFGATDPQSLGALVPGPVEARQRQLRAARRVRLEPIARQAASPSGCSARRPSSIRGGYGKSYDVLFYNILTVNGSNYPRVVVGRARQRARPLPEHRARDGRGGVQPASDVRQLARGHARARKRTTGACRGSASLRGTYVLRSRLHGQRSAATASLRTRPTTRVLTADQIATVQRHAERDVDSRPCSSDACSRSTARGR